MAKDTTKHASHGKAAKSDKRDHGAKHDGKGGHGKGKTAKATSGKKGSHDRKPGKSSAPRDDASARPTLGAVALFLQRRRERKQAKAIAREAEREAAAKRAAEAAKVEAALKAREDKARAKIAEKQAARQAMQDAVDRAEREEREAREAKERAKRETEEEKERRQREAQEEKERKQQEARDAKEQAAREAKEAKERAEREAKDAKERQAREEREAKEREVREAEEAARVAERAKAKAEADKARAAKLAEAEKLAEEQRKQREAERAERERKAQEAAEAKRLAREEAERAKAEARRVKEEEARERAAAAKAKAEAEAAALAEREAAEAAAEAARPISGFTVFLDRDGVFNTAPRFLVWSWSQFKPIPGVDRAFARLNRPEIRTCLATNQPFVGLGILWRGRLDRIHAHMMHELALRGGRLHRIEVSTVPWGIPSRRRKPAPGMFEDAVKGFSEQDWVVGRRAAVMIGDLPKDAQAAAAFGIPAILVATTHDRAWLEARVAKLGLQQTVVADDFGQAVDLTLERVAAAVRSAAPIPAS